MGQPQRAKHESSNADALLTELAAAHAELLRDLAAMQALQDGPQPGPDKWAQARWKLSRASRLRRTCIDRVYPLVLAEATAFERHRIDQLRSQDPIMLARSREHVETWTPDRIVSEWPGYCAASRLLRAGMADRVKSEQSIVVPILKRLRDG